MEDNVKKIPDCSAIHWMNLLILWWVKMKHMANHYLLNEN
ncbi:hypothetical Protein YC6258_00229 [Gynuella sunshinyii YC6258]|uniref:Uncharacterized protein n=1 Tax=Gynuella sunshinyii YC6258 TaxID=1445510 RepID=A0A0C5VDL4_9GAMM|nr:hypothetical Protein YC6258_00229 [Gynuella sunshinyii YC6258]